MLYLFKTISKIHIRFLFLIFLISLGWSELSYGYTAIVESAKLNMRVEPKLGASVNGVLKKGDTANITGPIDGRWVKVVYNNKEGFLRNRPIYIKIVADNSNFVIEKKKFDKEKTRIEEKINKEKTILSKYKKKSETILSGLEEIDKAINKSQKELFLVRQTYIETGDKIREEKNKADYLEKEITRLRPYVNKRLVSLYKFLRIGRMNLLFSVDSVVSFLKSQKALKDIVKSDLEVIEKYADLQNQYVNSLQIFEKEKEHLESLKSQIAKYLRIKESEKEKKEVLLKEIKEKQAMKLSVIRGLEEASIQLDDKMAKLKDKEKDVQKTFDGFSRYKGLLNLPVKGKIIGRFGTESKKENRFYSYKNGIGIQADLGEPVHSVFKGTVVFSDWFKGYGNMLIINHGESYYSIYAHVQEFFKQKGDMVQKDEVIATLGDTCSLSGPVLHFEVRHHGKPLNPLDWIKK